MTSNRMNRAVDMFEGFHEYDVSEVGAFDRRLVVPRIVYVVGRCVSVSYRSDKWNKGTYDYIHKIDSYPKVSCGVTEKGSGRPRQVPALAREKDQYLVRVGKVLDAVYEDEDGKVTATFPAGTEWFFSPRARTLFAISNRKKLHAVIWGGKLNVEDRGIVG